MSSIFMILSLVFISPNTTADYKVFVTKHKYEADLVVFKTEDKYAAKNSESIWYETDTKYSADFSVRYVPTRYQADLIIYFTKNKYEAGWKKPHQLRESLHDIN